MLEKFTPNTNRRIATGLSALALTAVMGSEVNAQPSRGESSNTTEQLEADPRIKLREKVVRMMYEGKLPNKCLDVVLTFSSYGRNTKTYNAAPVGPPDGIDSVAMGERQYYMGTAPRYLHYNGDDWLVFTHNMELQAQPNYNPVRGAADIPWSTLFMNVENLPKDAKIWVNPNGKEEKIDGKLHPAKINKTNATITCKDVPVGNVQDLFRMNTREPIDQYVKFRKLRTISPAKIRGLK